MGVVLPLVGAVITLVAIALTTTPDPLATHWDLSGDPDGSMSRTMFIAGVAILSAGGIAFVAATSRRSVDRRGDLVAPVAVATFLNWVLIAVTVTVLLANDGRASWEQARSVGLPLALLGPAAAALVAMVAGRLMAGVGEVASLPGDRPQLERRRGESVAWFGHVRAGWPVGLGGAVIAVGSVFVFALGIFIGLLVIISGVAIAMLSTVRVAIDRDGVTVRYGPFEWPRTHIGLDRVAHADLIDVRPMSHGGWGYRGSLRVFRRAAVVLRAGPGIEFTLTDGRRFVVTVDDAETGAAAINSLVG